MVHPSVDGFRIVRDLEPEHPDSTYSHPVAEAVELASGRSVALKRYSLGFPLRPETRATYHLAVQRLRAVSSPHVVPVLSGGFVGEGEPWLAMELLPVEPLEGALRHGVRFGPREVATILGAVAAAMSASYEVELGHELLVPSHVLLGPTGARLSTFGIGAWMVAAQQRVAGQYTAAGRARLIRDITPDAAAGRPLGPRDGAAAVALIGFRMLTGRHFWRAANDPDPSPMYVLLEAMAPVDTARVRAEPGVPEGFDAWMHTCLSGGFTDASTAMQAMPR